MKYIEWEGYIKLNTIVALPETTTYKEVAEAIAARLQDEYNFEVSVDAVKGIEEIGEYEEESLFS